MKIRLKRLKIVANEFGGSALDYAMLASLVLCVCVSAISFLGAKTQDKWHTSGQTIVTGGDGINPETQNCSPMNDPSNC